MAVISARGLTKHYGDTVAVKGLDLDIDAGEVFGLLGPNGAGKTTTILMLLGLTEPTAGSVHVLGLDPRHRALEIKARTGYVPDSVGFYDHLSGRQNLRYTARLNGLHGPDAEARIDDVLDLVGLSESQDRAVGGYSRGMQQRLGLADALLNEPRLLILDEPTVNIDPEGVSDLLHLVGRLAGEGVTVMLSSHLLHQVQAVCDRIGIFVAGELVAAGTVDELARQLDDRYVIEVDSTGDRRVMAGVLSGVDGVVDVVDDGQLLIVSSKQDVRSAIADAVHDRGETLVHLRRRRAELDAIYHRYFHATDTAATSSQRAAEEVSA